MSHKPITELFNNLQKIDRDLDICKESAVLIGGVAVQWYRSARQTQDIDIVLSNRAFDSILELYDEDEWEHDDQSNNPIRPAYRLSHRYEDLADVHLGPKRRDETSYPFIPWRLVDEYSKAWIVDGFTFKCIRIPTKEFLCFTKLISFLMRVERDPDKGRKDLEDAAALLKKKDFGVGDLVDIVRKAGAEEFLAASFSEKACKFDIYRESSLPKLCSIFGCRSSEDEDVKLLSVVEKQGKIGRNTQEWVGRHEAIARKIYEYSGPIFCSFLQTLDYATVILSTLGAREPVGGAEARLKRQEILADSTREFRVVFHELAVNQPIASPTPVLDAHGQEIDPLQVVIDNLKQILEFIRKPPGAKLSIGMLSADMSVGFPLLDVYQIHDETKVMVDTDIGTVLGDQKVVGHHLSIFEHVYESSLKDADLAIWIESKLEQLAESR